MMHILSSKLTFFAGSKFLAGEMSISVIQIMSMYLATVLKVILSMKV